MARFHKWVGRSSVQSPYFWGGTQPSPTHYPGFIRRCRLGKHKNFKTRTYVENERTHEWSGPRRYFYQNWSSTEPVLCMLNLTHQTKLALFKKKKNPLNSTQLITTSILASPCQIAMAVLNYIPVTATSAPISQDSSSTSSSVPNTRPTKILLPKKKPMKWSTGVAAGEYGGPPTTTKLRKFWGGEKEDPLTSDEFIWNNDFMPRMKRLIEDTDESSAAEKFPVQVFFQYVPFVYQLRFLFFFFSFRIWFWAQLGLV